MSQHFLHSEVRIRANEALEVVLEGREANVMLLDAKNFERYRAGKSFHYYGGHFRRSPVVLRPPRSGTWNLVVDLGGLSGRVRASYAVRTAKLDESPSEDYSSEDDPYDGT